MGLVEGRGGFVDGAGAASSKARNRAWASSSRKKARWSRRVSSARWRALSSVNSDSFCPRNSAARTNSALVSAEARTWITSFFSLADGGMTASCDDRKKASGCTDTVTKALLIIALSAIVAQIDGGLVRIFVNKAFRRFAAQESISDRDLREAIARAESGLVDADLGGGVIKQRIARRGQGKSGGYRSIILFRRETVAYFVYGYAKSSRSSIGQDELRAFRVLAAEMLGASDDAIAGAVRNGTLWEVSCDG